MSYFLTSFLFMIIGLGAAFFLGGFAFVYIAFLLIILEISLSFDNAVVNAKVLQKMEPVWQRKFIFYGIPIAVFGMRLLFPLAIVAIAAHMNMFQTLHMALNEPSRYEDVLKSVEGNIFAFGGAFLLMVFLDFLFEEKEVAWIKILERSKFIKKASLVTNIELIIAIAVALFIGHLTHEFSILLAFIYGVLLHTLLGMIDDLFSTKNIKNGIAGFLYLEVLDASFSFDGVIGAFAISSNIFIIMIGLGVGAMFIRSLTLYFVAHKTLSNFRYLEHGAHYAIGILSVIMLAKIMLHINEVITGTIGIGLIILAFLHSIAENKREEKITSKAKKR